MNKIKDFLMTKKTLTGAILMFGLFGLQGLGIITQDQFDQYGRFAEAILGIGLVHKAIKAV